MFGRAGRTKSDSRKFVNPFDLVIRQLQDRHNVRLVERPDSVALPLKLLKSQPLVWIQDLLEVFLHLCEGSRLTHRLAVQGTIKLLIRKALSTSIVDGERQRV